MSRALQRCIPTFAPLEAQLFAIIVLLCDHYLHPQKHGRGSTQEFERSFRMSYFGRFCDLVTHLPMELQMTICHRAFGSAGNNIASTQLDLALRSFIHQHIK